MMLVSGYLTLAHHILEHAKVKIREFEERQPYPCVLSIPVASCLAGLQKKRTSGRPRRAAFSVGRLTKRCLCL